MRTQKIRMFLFRRGDRGAPEMAVTYWKRINDFRFRRGNPPAFRGIAQVNQPG